MESPTVKPGNQNCRVAEEQKTSHNAIAVSGWQKEESKAKVVIKVGHRVEVIVVAPNGALLLLPVIVLFRVKDICLPYLDRRPFHCPQNNAFSHVTVSFPGFGRWNAALSPSVTFPSRRIAELLKGFDFDWNV